METLKCFEVSCINKPLTFSIFLQKDFFSFKWYLKKNQKTA